jgi:hypothetical protein
MDYIYILQGEILKHAMSVSIEGKKLENLLLP